MRVRGLTTSIVDEAIELDNKVRRHRRELDELRYKRNQITRIVGKSSPEEKTILLKDAKNFTEKIKSTESEFKDIKDRLYSILLSIPNILHSNVPVGLDERDNKPLRFWGKPKVMKKYIKRFMKETYGF